MCLGQLKTAKYFVKLINFYKVLGNTNSVHKVMKEKCATGVLGHRFNRILLQLKEIHTKL